MRSLNYGYKYVVIWWCISEDLVSKRFTSRTDQSDTPVLVCFQSNECSDVFNWPVRRVLRFDNLYTKCCTHREIFSKSY